MSATAVRIPLEQAHRLALDLVELLAASCTRIEIAGSVRRRIPEVKDIEIVCVPRLNQRPGQLIDSGEKVSAVNSRVQHLVSGAAGDPAIGGGQLTLNREKPANGDRYKRLLYGGVKVDLFCVLPPASWGVQFALRTGPAEWSHTLVKKQTWGGLCPDNCRIGEHGQLLWDGNPQTCHEECDFFAKLGIPWVNPKDRTLETLSKLLRRKR